MTSKMFLTSVAAVMLAMPAMAEPWPANDIMLEDKTYDNAATEEHMLVSADGATANATADYEAILYQIAAGKYLPAGAESVIDCDQNGYFCPGDSNGVNYSESNAQGLTQCPSGFANTATGASANTDCYRTCDINNMGTSFANIAHATNVSGNDYYGNGVDTCVVTACENGWHVKAGTAPDLKSLIGVEYGKGYAANNTQGDKYDAHNMSNSIIAGDKMAFAVDYGDKGMLIGQARCSTQAGSNGWYTNGNYDGNGDWSNITKLSSLTDETGQEGAKYCYCNVTGYKDASGNMQSLSSSWVFIDKEEFSAGDCARRCAVTLWTTGTSEFAFRAAVFDSISDSPAMCEANTINIQWDGIDEPTTVTYGGDITTPVSAEKRPGQRFKGWKFTTPGQTTGD